MPEQDDPVLEYPKDLVRALGGDSSTGSYTHHLVQLIQKADVANLARLRLAYPRQVRAWELWVQLGPQLTESKLHRLLDADPMARSSHAAVGLPQIPDPPQVLPDDVESQQAWLEWASGVRHSIATFGDMVMSWRGGSIYDDLPPDRVARDPVQ